MSHAKNNCFVTYTRVFICAYNISRKIPKVLPVMASVGEEARKRAFH